MPASHNVAQQDGSVMESSVALAGPAPPAGLRDKLASLFEKAERQLGGNEPQAAREVLDEALELALKLGDGEAEVKAVRLLLKCCFFVRDAEGAIELGNKALKRAREIGDRRQLALVHNDLGIVFGSLNLYTRAVEHVLSSIRQLTELGENDLSRQLNNLGNVYFAMEEFGRALKAYQEGYAMLSEEICRTHGIALGNIGRAQLALGDIDDAEVSNRRSVAVFQELGDEVYLPSALVRLGNLYVGARRPDEALACYRQALAGSRQNGPNPWREEALVALGQLLLAQGEVAEAVKHLEEAVPLAAAGGSTGTLSVAHRELASAYEQFEKPERALEHFKEYHQARERILQEQSEQAARTALVEFEVERLEREREIYRLRNIELAHAYSELKNLRDQLEEQNCLLSELSIRDSLTGLHNRRFLDDVLPHEIARAQRYDRPLSLMICDIDAFKRINDRFAHALGDEVLRRIGRILEENTREADMVARYGGEEFVVVFPELDLAAAVSAAEKLRRAVMNHPWHELHEGVAVTVSCGVAELVAAENRDALLQSADKELYRAKRSGRNRVCFAGSRH